MKMGKICPRNSIASKAFLCPLMGPDLILNSIWSPALPGVIIESQAQNIHRAQLSVPSHRPPKSKLFGCKEKDKKNLKRTFFCFFVKTKLLSALEETSSLFYGNPEKEIYLGEAGDI